MKKIYLLIDYKERFGSKYSAEPYRSGMDKRLLARYFNNSGYDAKYLNFSRVNFREIDFRGVPVLYTSQEDWGYHYKSYIEDIVLGLELHGAKVIPSYRYLRANNNKVFMEILRDQLKDEGIKTIKSFHFGCLEELKANIDTFEFPVVIKSAAGAMSTGVYLAHNKKELIKYAKIISRTKFIKQEIKDIGRAYKHKKYIRESRYREKYIIQNYILNLVNDWKIIVFGERYYILYRGIKNGDFRASGSHIFEFNKDDLIPTGIFDFAKKIYDIFDIPNLSLDIGFDIKEFHLIEFQAIYFGTSTMEKSNGFFKKKDNSWEKVVDKLPLEKVYVDSIKYYITGNNGKQL